MNIIPCFRHIVLTPPNDRLSCSAGRRHRVLFAAGTVASVDAARTVQAWADTEGFRQRFMRRLRMFLRACALAFIWSPALLLLPCAYFDRTWPMYVDVVASCFRRSGPVAMKLAQWVTSRPDVFPQLVCDRLAQFQHTAPTHSGQVTLQLLSAEGPDFNRHLSHVVLEPIGSGTVAQVHRAVWDGHDVAVKILHPRIREHVTIDLQLARGAARAITWIAPSTYYMDLAGTVAEFTSNMMAQLDLRTEGANLLRFRENFKKDHDVRFPFVYAARENVLVMSHEDGVHLTEVLRDPDFPHRKKIAAVGMRTFLQMVFGDNFVHADLHAGNILIDLRNNGIIVLDAGLTLSLSNERRRNLLDLFLALAAGDGQRGAQLMLDNSVGSHCDDPEQFQREMDAIFQRVSKANFGTTPLGGALLDVLRCTQRHHVRLDSKYCSLITSAIVLEGVGRQLDPGMNLFYISPLRFVPRH